MCFKKIYNKVEELKELDVYEIIKQEGIDIVWDDDLLFGDTAWMMEHDEHTIFFIKNYQNENVTRNLLLHELGHYYFDSGWSLANKQTEENNANLFMCLFLLKNQIWEASYFQMYLISQGIENKVAQLINNMIYQYKMTVLYDYQWLNLEC